MGEQITQPVLGRKTQGIKVVHTSDWHAGKKLKGKVDRNEDLERALSHILDFIKEEKVDLLLVSGDVFDKPKPDNRSIELVFNFFAELQGYGVESVIIPGNHDSFGFLQAFEKILKLAKCKVVAGHSENPSQNVVETKGVRIACFPFPFKVQFSGSDGLEFSDKVVRYISKMRESMSPDRPKILLAHLMIWGAKIAWTERAVHVKDEYAIVPQKLPAFDYIALGHVHINQKVEVPHSQGFYAGTVYQLDFGEAGQEKYFIFFELDEKGGFLKPPEKQKIPLKRELLNLEFDLDKVSLNEVFGRLEDEIRRKKLVKLKIRFSKESERKMKEIRQKTEEIATVFLEPERKDLEKTRSLQVKVSSLTPENIFEEYRTFVEEREGKHIAQKIIDKAKKIFEKAYEEKAS